MAALATRSMVKLATLVLMIAIFYEWQCTPKFKCCFPFFNGKVKIIKYFHPFPVGLVGLFC